MVKSMGCANTFDEVVILDAGSGNNSVACCFRQSSQFSISFLEA